MRKPLLLIVALLFIQLTNAQTKTRFKPIKVDFALGAPIQSKENGFIISFEPSYNFSDYKIGVRMQEAILYMKYAGSWLLTADRYLTRDYASRPFIGGGIGAFSVSESAGCGGGPGTGKTVHSTKPFGGMVRGGFELHHFRLSFEYNFVADTHVTDYDQSAKFLAMRVYKSAYFGITAGVNIGGRPKKK